MALLGLTMGLQQAASENGLDGGCGVDARKRGLEKTPFDISVNNAMLNEIRGFVGFALEFHLGGEDLRMLFHDQPPSQNLGYGQLGINKRRCLQLWMGTRI
jgi:hypothetical protein